MNKKQLAKMMDHTILKATATPQQVEKVCEEAKQIGAATVCINPCQIAFAKKILAGSEVKICTVIGFPLGANTTATKAFEAKDAIERGADEVDMVINIGALLAGDTETVYNDIRGVVEAANGTLVKVIIETCYLEDEHKKTACALALKAGADFVKTSTGFGTGGASIGDVELMRGVVADKMQIKASGGIRTYEQAMAMVEASANRLGVSASLQILKGMPE